MLSYGTVILFCGVITTESDFFQHIIALLRYVCYISAIELRRRSTSLSFADTIKFIRRKSLLSQNDFAQALGVSFSTVNRWENGRSVPKLCKLKLINQFCIERDIPFDVEKFMIKFESDIAGME